MVVSVHIGVVSHPGLARPHGRHQPEFREQPQGAINSVQGNSRHFFADVLEDRFDVRVVLGPGRFAEDLEALMGEFDAGEADDVLESDHYSPQFLRLALH
jgi:hypothetical protein